MDNIPGSGIFKGAIMPKYKLEPGENLMEFVGKCGINVHDIWNHADNKGLRDRVGNPWLVAPGEEVVEGDENAE